MSILDARRRSITALGLIEVVEGGGVVCCGVAVLVRLGQRFRGTAFFWGGGGGGFVGVFMTGKVL